MMKQQRLFVPTLCALLAVVVFSTSGLCIKAIPLESLSISLLRSAMAVVFFSLYFLVQGRFTEAFRIRPLGWVIAVAYTVTLTLFCVSMKLTTAANTIFLQYTMPAWVLIGGAIWLKERVTVSRVLSILVCLAGMLLFFQGEIQAHDWYGNLTALLSGFSFAVMTLCLRVEREQNPLSTILLGNILTVATNVPLVLWLYPEQFPLIFESSWPAWGAIVWLGCFQIGVAYILFTTALRWLPAIEVAILSLLEPVLNPFLVLIFLGEVPSNWAISGGIVIMLSVLIRAFSITERKAKEAVEPV